MIYAIQSTGDAVKFGHSIDVSKRMRQLQTGQTHALTLIASCDGTLPMERNLHACLRAILPLDRLLAGEWYKPHSIVVDTVKAICSGLLASHIADLETLSKQGRQDSERIIPKGPDVPEEFLEDLKYRLQRAGFSHADSYYLLVGGVTALFRRSIQLENGREFKVTEPLFNRVKVIKHAD